MVLGSSFTSLATNKPLDSKIENTLSRVEVSKDSLNAVKPVKPSFKSLPAGKIINLPVFYVYSIQARAYATDSTGALYYFKDFGFNRYNENYSPSMYSTVSPAAVTNAEIKLKEAGYTLAGWKLTTQVEVHTSLNIPQAIKHQINENGRFTTIPLNSNDKISTHYISYDCTAPSTPGQEYGYMISGEYI